MAYIDLIYQVFRIYHYSYRELEIRHLSIYRPLVVHEDRPIRLTIDCIEQEEGHWRVRLEGEEAVGVKTVYAVADMLRCIPMDYEESVDFESVRNAATRSFSMDELYKRWSKQQLIHTGLMKTEGQVFEDDEARFIELGVDKEIAISDSSNFMFHPAVIDGVGAGSEGLFDALIKDETKLFLPIYIKSFRASDLIENSCLAKIPITSIKRNGELLYMDIIFYNDVGHKIGEMKQLTNKIVRDGSILDSQEGSNDVSEQEQFIVEETGQADNQVLRGTKYGDEQAPSAQVFLKEVLAQYLEKPAEEIEINIGYYEMGLDSPGLLEAVDMIGTKIGVELSPTLLFEYTTISQLATYLSEAYPDFFATSVFQKSTKLNFEHQPRKESKIKEKHSSLSMSEAAATSALSGDIAVIGISGRYPGATNMANFWLNLLEGKDLVREVPETRWDWKQHEGISSPSGKPISKWGGFIDDPDCFDASFFRITPREAETLDPQERLFLETCWEAIEDSGYTPEDLVFPQGRNKRRPVGVFAGVMQKDYTLLGVEALGQGNLFPLSHNYAPIANRVSYFCNFHGPSMTIDTVCSSSLTAVHLALESIRHGECEVALAGGVNLSLHPGKYLSYGLADMHASDGRCRTFGKDGDGYVSGEGVGVVVLKSLRKAEEDGDHIYAVIKGSVINHVGAVSGITVPSPVAQGEMIETCLEKTGIDPRTISYIEAHGTGTSLGDPIEIQGLEKAFRRYTEGCSILFHWFGEVKHRTCGVCCRDWGTA
nr:beta-ketoacyl synthase N-terminal-like domain-containing protein [Bacillus thuringiensis]